MTDTRQVAVHKWLMPLRIVRVRWRLFLAAGVGLFAFFVVPGERLITRVLIGWDIGVVVYLALFIWTAMVTDTHHIRLRSVLFDEGRLFIPLACVTAALASLGAIFFQLSTGPAAHRFVNLAFAAVTILLSWSFIQFIFAFHYAHEFYAEHRGTARGLKFPGKEAPDYWDFLYFSFVIGMTSQVSDVSVTSKPLRRTVTGHGLLSFIFNAALLALAINLAASAIGNPTGAVLDDTQCQTAWKVASSNGATLSKDQAGPYIVDFQKVDFDGDGKITADEFRTACVKGLVKPTKP